MAALPEMFAHGVEGYTDDRLADGDGWTTFNVADITCPVIVLHGSADVIADPIHARHTASIVPDADLRIVPGAGHFSIEDHIVPTLVHLRHRAA
jgi:pimeloyl-ACP methyl ester carboxylesterase